MVFKHPKGFSNQIKIGWIIIRKIVKYLVHVKSCLGSQYNVYIFHYNNDSLLGQKTEENLTSDRIE